MKKYLFNQPAGIGDILFIMAIAQKYHEEGHTIIWPTAVHYHNIQKNFPEVKFMPEGTFGLYDFYDSKRTIFEDENYKVFPFRWADTLYNDGKTNLHTGMADKYRMVNLPLDMWRTYKITRDYEMEDKLFKSLGLNEGDEYNLVNENQTRIFQKTRIEPKNGLRNIYMNRDDPQYNMLDWLKVIYNATTIHTVSTSLIWVLDRFHDIPAKEQHIYSRIWDVNKPNPHEDIDYIMKKNFIYH